MASPALNLRRFTVTEYHAMAEAGVFGPEAGIPEVWIVLPEKRRVEMYRQPERNRYAETQTLGAEGALSVAALPDLPPVSVADVLR